MNKEKRKCRTGEAFEELEELEVLEETRWLLSATVENDSRALHLHMKGTCMEMGTDGSTDDGYEDDVLEIMEWSRAVEVMVGDSLSTAVRRDIIQNAIQDD